MTKWNDMQKKAIYTKNKNVIVSASAGSGKTTVLIARLLHLVRDEKVDITSILAMTFTEAAANEMKKRLAKELQNALETCNEEEKEYLNSQLAKLSNAYISTIHGFCLNIIQNYYYTIGLESQSVSNILDEGMQKVLHAKAMKKTLNEYMDNPIFRKLCALFSSRPESTQALEEAILKLYYLASAQSDADVFLDSCIKNHKIQNWEDIDKSSLNYFFDYLSTQCESIIESINRLNFVYEDEALLLLQKKQTALKEAKEYLNKQDYSEFRTLFLAQSKLLLPIIKEQEITKNTKKEVEALEDSLHQILFEEKELLQFSNDMIPYTNMMANLCHTFLHHYQKFKEEAKGIDFADMEHYALKILEANQGLVASLYRDQFYEIMVDEFQDSNDVQDKLVKMICRPNNVFRVGDIKQSIYGFRHATPAIMRGLIASQNEQDEVIYLSNNYRSKKSIIDFNNFLFQKLMNIQGLDASFSEYDHTQSGLSSQEEDCAPIQFHCIDEKAISQTIDASKDELKSSYIANQIIQMRKQGYTFKDFVVLIKTNAKSECLREAFEKVNIPYFINMKHGFYSSSAVQNVITFLQALHHPHDDLYFCALMLSPFFNYDNSTLAQASIHKDKKESYYTYFKRTHNITLFDDIKTHITKYRLSEILAMIFECQSYYEKYTSLQEKTNLDKLYEMIIQMESKRHISIPYFLNLLKQSKDAKIGEAIPIGSNDDVVRVMSIHQSKGLQFPVVFLYSTSSINLQDTRGLCAVDEELHIAMNATYLPHRLVYPTIERIAYNHKTTKSAIEEEMRVLYVATTRAQKEMHIVECIAKDTFNPLTKAEIYKKKGFSEWILQSFDESYSSLFQVKHINEYWDIEALDKIKNQDIILPRYYHTTCIQEVISPSEYEFSYTPRPFSFYEEKAMEHGNMLHKMSELLPHKNINTTIIDKIAKEKNIILSDNDKQMILKLYDNEIYRYSFKGETYHEYPFMVEINNTIMHGYMDYISIMDKTIILIDFKSDQHVNEKELLERYKKQILAYKNALHILYPDKEVQSYIYSFTLNKMIDVSS